MNTTIKNARITDTMFGWEDHGILTFALKIEGYGWGCSYGYYGISYHCQETDTQVYDPRGLQAIGELLKFFDVDTWESLKGKYVRCELERTQIVRVGRLIEDKWFSLRDIFNENSCED